jgi:hypothetical protein
VGLRLTQESAAVGLCQEKHAVDHALQASEPSEEITDGGGSLALGGRGRTKPFDDLLHVRQRSLDFAG